MEEKITILVVDDSRTVRASLRKCLMSEFEVVEAEDGEAGWAALSEHPEIRLVVSDIFMPRLDGYGFICRIRSASEESIRNKPVIVITSAEDDASRTRAYACGANDFILKPVQAGDLLNRIRLQMDAHLNGRMHVADDMRRYEPAIEDAVLETPDLRTAIELLKKGQAGAIEPYLVDLCLDVLPLFEYASQVGHLGIESELYAIKVKLNA